MEDRSATHNTFVIERSYPSTPEQVFAAFADPVKKHRWYAREGESQDVVSFEMDFRVGGKEQACYQLTSSTPFPGVTITNDGIHLDIVPNRRIVIASNMMLGERRISASLVTFELLPTEKGTDLIFTHQGVFFEGSDGPQMREEGWRKLLELLAESLTH